MRKLTDNEIKFIKETKWSPTLVQMSYSKGELARTPFKDYEPEEAENKYVALAIQYGVGELTDLYKKTCDIDNNDAISLEFEATYLLYTFFSKDELVDLDNVWGLHWLQDFKYYFGYRKWEPFDVEIAIQEALEIYGGSREFYECPEDGDVWNREIEKIN